MLLIKVWCREVRSHLDAQGNIIKIVEVKSGRRITLPKDNDKLKVNENDYVAILEDDQPGVRLIKVKLDIKGMMRDE